MNKIVERYAAAVNRGDLSSDARSTRASSAASRSNAA